MGQINGNGMIEISVTGTGENSYLSKLWRWLNKRNRKNQLDPFQTDVAKWFILYCLIRRCVSIYRLVTRNEDLSLAFERIVYGFVCLSHALEA